eukprot:TRINITY_DN5470_c0_g1_i1.p1 TRINITY_DN5470_c0_g1~~TRINITY_DN5470_c0_g1_i1.p1  ORF type:complete len:468 (-),score=63.12 TRINITY_DN5470_c0_g1_i1:127-1404(-)
MGRFIHHLIQCMRTWGQDDPDIAAAFFVRKRDPDQSSSPPSPPRCIIDQAVYTRNRMMRCFLSTKMGKDSSLRASGRCRFPFRDERHLFFASLICNLDGVGLTGDDTGLLCADPEIALLSFGSNADRRHPCPSNADPDRTGTVAYGPSPFPHLDAFFSALVQNNGRGRIKSWLTYPRSDGDPEAGECPHCAIGHVLYNIVDNRFCLNVGREHKSNSIYFVCHLAQGLYYQKCYDAADCPNFRSPAFHIPPEVLPRCTKDGPCIIAPVSDPVPPFPVTSLLPRGRAPLQIIGTNATPEGVRSTMAARLATTLTKDPAADPDVSLTCARGIVDAVHALSDGDAPAARRRVHTLCGAFEHPSHGQLRADVLSGALTPLGVARLTPEDLAIPEQRRCRIIAKDKALLAHLTPNAYTAVFAARDPPVTNA